jgi:hypothetical protein
MWRLPGRRFALIFALCSFAATVQAASNADVLPCLALNSPPSPSSPSIWSGLYIGSGIFAISGNGSKGHVGGDGEIGYDHEFQNGLVVGVDAIGGYSPGLWANSPAKGFDFGATDQEDTTWAGGCRTWKQALCWQSSTYNPSRTTSASASPRMIYSPVRSI